MALDNPRSGPYSTMEFTASPLPWLTSSIIAAGQTVRHDFPQVASRFTLQNVSSGSLQVGFTSDGVATLSRYFQVFGNQQLELSCRFKSLVIKNPNAGQAAYDLFVGVTGVHSRDFMEFSGSSLNV